VSAFLPRGWDHLVASDWDHPACRAVGLAVRPAWASGHGQAWEVLEAERERITEWVGKDLSVVKIADLLAARCAGPVPHAAPVLHRAVRVPVVVAAPRCGWLRQSRGWSARSTSPGWTWCMTRARAGVGWRMR